MRVLRFLIGQGGHAGLQRARWDVWPVGPGSPLSLLNYAVVIRKQPQTGRKQTGVAVSQSSLVSRIRPRPVVCCPLLGNDLGIFRILSSVTPRWSHSAPSSLPIGVLGFHWLGRNSGPETEAEVDSGVRTPEPRREQHVHLHLPPARGGPRCLQVMLWSSSREAEKRLM